MKWISASLALIWAVLLTCGSAAAQNASTLVLAGQGRSYGLMKRAIAENMKGSDASLSFDRERKTLDLYYCSSYEDLGGLIGKQNSKSDRLSHLMGVAYDTLILRNGITSAGYPPSVWTSFMESRERSGLAGRELSGDDPGELRNLAALLNNYRSHGHGSLPAVVVEGGCGAGGTSVSFETSPPGGRVLLVPKMYHSLCRLEGLDPDDDRRCDFWQEIFPGQEPDVSGDYYAKIVWPDHSVIRSFSAAKLSDGVNRVTLR